MATQPKLSGSPPYGPLLHGNGADAPTVRVALSDAHARRVLPGALTTVMTQAQLQKRPVRMVHSPPLVDSYDTRG